MKPHPLPPIEMLRATFRYDEETGLLHWKIKPSKAIAIGDIAGCPKNDSYWRVKLAYKIYPAHRIIWAILYGREPDLIIDHIDGNKLNNRIENLRESTYSQNIANGRLPKSNTSGLKGAYKHRDKWTAQIGVRGKYHYLGRFNSKEEAHAAYCDAAAKYFGDFARTS